MEKKNIIILVTIFFIAVTVLSVGFVMLINRPDGLDSKDIKSYSLNNFSKRALTGNINEDVIILSTEFEQLFPPETKQYDFSGLKQYVESNEETIFQEMEKGINKSVDGFIGVGGKTWEFNTINQDELNVSIIQVHNNGFIVYPYSINSKVTSDLNYKWKATINISGQDTILKQNLSSSELDTPIFFSVLDNINYFELKIGASSTVINATATPTATIHSPSDRFVINSTGGFIVAFIGTGQDLFTAQSWNYGKNWKSQNAYTGTILRTGLTLSPNGTLLAYFSEGGDIKGIYSSDMGSTWGTVFPILDDIVTPYSNPSCQFDSNDIVHCAVISGIAAGTTARYTNSSYWNGSNYQIINDNINNNTNEVDLEIDSLNNPWVVGSGVDFDCVDVWSVGAKGWGDTNRIPIYCSISYVEGRANDLTIRSVNGVEQLYIISTLRGRLRVSNTTLTNNQSWSNSGDLTTTGIESEPTSAITQRGWYVGLFSNATIGDSGSAIKMVNSTNFSTFSLNLSVKIEGANFPSIADSNYPTTNRLDGTNGTVHYIYTDDNGEVIYDNIRIPIETATSSCSYTSGNWNVACSDNCVISSNVNLGGNNIILSGTGTFTVNNGVQIRKFNNLRSDKTCYVRTNGNGGFLK